MYIEDLPGEIIMKILEYIPQHEIPSLIYTCSRFRDLIYKVPVKGTLNLEKAHLINTKDMKQFFHKTSVALNLRKLVINGIWWTDFHKFIIKCPNLEALHMMDVNILFPHLLAILRSCPKLQDIEFSWPKPFTIREEDDNDFTEIECLPNIKYLKIGRTTNNYDYIIKFLHLTPSLVKLEIWGHVAGFYTHLPLKSSEDELRKEISLLHLKELKMVNVANSMVDESLHVRLTNESKINDVWNFFSEKLNSPAIINLFEHCEYLTLRATPKIQNIFKNSISNYPYIEYFSFHSGMLNYPVTEIISKMSHLKRLYVFAKGPLPLDLNIISKYHPSLRSLGFQCFDDIHSTSYVEGELDSFTDLRHLCVPPCVLIEKSPTSSFKSPLDKSILFKAPRRGEKVEEKVQEAAFNKVLESCNDLEVLEIARFDSKLGFRICDMAGLHWHCLANIKKLRHLTVLSLEFIPISSGFFFSEIAESCKNLKVLRLKDLGMSGKCSYLKELSECLPKFKNLNSFRLQNNYLLPGTSLFEALTQCSRLERIAIMSRRDDYHIDETALLNLVAKSSLLFAFFRFEGISLKTVSRIAKEAKSRKAEYLYLKIVKEMNSDILISMPLKHCREMVFFYPWCGFY